MNEIAKPVAIKVAQDDRMDFLPKHFGKLFLEGENMVFNWMRLLSPEYHGGTGSITRSLMAFSWRRLARTPGISDGQ